MKINEFVTRANIEDVAHSSGYARAQNGKSFGATSSQTFSQRVSIDRRRTKIKAYEHSKVANRNFSQRAGISEMANSSLEKIRESRVERQNFLSGEKPQFRSGAMNSRPDFRAKRDFSQIRQSGAMGAPSTASVSRPTSASFHQIRPQIDR